MSDKQHFLALGEYRFVLDKNEYETLQRAITFRWQKQDIINNRPHYQLAGLGEETLTITGAVFNYQANQSADDSPISATGRDQIAQLRDEAHKGTPLRLALDDGRHLGYWVMKYVSEYQSHLIGSAPLKQAYTLNLMYFGERV